MFVVDPTFNVFFKIVIDSKNYFHIFKKKVYIFSHKIRNKTVVLVVTAWFHNNNCQS